MRTPNRLHWPFPPNGPKLVGKEQMGTAPPHHQHFPSYPQLFQLALLALTNQPAGQSHVSFPRSPSPHPSLAQPPLCGSRPFSFPGSYPRKAPLHPITHPYVEGVDLCLLIQSFVGTCMCFGLWVLTLHSNQGSWRTGDYHFLQKSQGFSWDRGCICPIGL